MFVADWMTTKVFTLAPDSSVLEAMDLIRARKIKHIPVLKGERIVGIVSDTDIRAYGPTAATTLDVYELHYLLAKLKVEQIMKRAVVSAGPDMPIEEAAMLLCDRDIGSLPIVDGGRLVGILSDRDIFRALVDISGARHGGHRVNILLDDRPGSIREIADIIRKHGFSIVGILTSYEKVPEGRRNLVIRMRGEGDFAAFGQ